MKINHYIFFQIIIGTFFLGGLIGLVQVGRVLMFVI